MTGAALADLGGLLADRTRARICVALLDGRAWTASELAALVGVAPSTASEHLSRLVAGGLLTERRQSRHRYVQIASAEVAQLLEDMVAYVAPHEPPPVGLRKVSAAAALAQGRTCYDHLAGRLGVAITDALGERGLLDRGNGFALTADGLGWFRAELAFTPQWSRRPVARECLDWTERRAHLGGQAGAHVRAYLQLKGCLERRGSGRAVQLTPVGARLLHAMLGLEHTIAGSG